MTVKRGPAPIVDLERWRPRNLRQAAQLHNALIERAGETRTKSGALVMALVTGEELPSATKTNYRMALAKLGSPPWDPDGEEPEPVKAPIRSIHSYLQSGGAIWGFALTAKVA